jgi:hypothetical protein
MARSQAESSKSRCFSIGCRPLCTRSVRSAAAYTIGENAEAWLYRYSAPIKGLRNEYGGRLTCTWSAWLGRELASGPALRFTRFSNRASALPRHLDGQRLSADRRHLHGDLICPLIKRLDQREQARSIRIRARAREPSVRRLLATQKKALAANLQEPKTSLACLFSLRGPREVLTKTPCSPPQPPFGVGVTFGAPCLES